MKIMRARGKFLFVSLFIAGVMVLSAWLSNRYYLQFDWTATQRNSLSAASSNLLQHLQGRVELTAYLPAGDSARQALQRLVERYQQIYPAMDLRIIDPSQDPQTVREQNIASGGELIIRYQDREQRLQQISEYSLTNALQRLLRENSPWLVFLQGHGERDPLGEANHDLGRFGERLKDSGFRIQTHDFLLMPVIPDNTRVLIIAGPRSAYLPGEIALLQNYLRNGGNLFWLAEPGDAHAYQEFANELGINFLPGVVVDAFSEKLNLATPDFILTRQYPEHPVTRDLDTMALFPQTIAMITLGSDWQVTRLLQSSAQSWNETGPISGEINQDRAQNELPGPHLIGLALERPHRDQEQRVVVLGDGDFLSNAYLNNGANLELGLRIMNWLVGTDNLIDVQQQNDPDIALEVSNTSILMIAAIFLVLLPLLFIGIAFFLWWRQRHA